MPTIRLTTSQAIIGFLKKQYIQRDETKQLFFAGCFGIFGHGNVAGIGQALQQNPDFKYYQARNEQAMVHIASAYAKMKNRLQTFACTSSIGPGATNMVTAAAAATVNRLPVLLLPGDIFAKRNVAPVLQQIEWNISQDISANDALKPVSRYWDRINRPEQILTSLFEAMRVLTSQADTGAVTLALPQDVQAEAYDYPRKFFKPRVWTIARTRPDKNLLNQACKWIKESKHPLIIAGGGVIYSEATNTLRKFAEETGIPVAETQAGKGSMLYSHPLSLGAIGATGTPGANILAREADLIIGIGTRYSDFTTASKTAFQNPNVRFVNINVIEFDAYKLAGLPLVGDAQVTLEELLANLPEYKTSSDYQKRVKKFNEDWDLEVERIYHLGHEPIISQGEIIGAVNEFSQPRDVVVCAAGSLPGDLHKLWRTRDSKGYHLEYGYSCMGYEIAGGLGVKMADPDREVYVLVGDGSWMMMSQEIVTSIQEGYKLIVVLLNNHGFASIGGLSASLGSAGFGTRYLFRDKKTGQISGDYLPVDFAGNARSLGAYVIEANSINSFLKALKEAKEQQKTTVIVVETDRDQRVGGYESWWDVVSAEVSENPDVKSAREKYEKEVKKERYFL
ncbi:MAG: 3D-(3,5/4)-trihydroxycyclohexane-1,2-dione acylhydrolase (decyclizing) [Anaerolineaceae bacterium]|nr:3D-(3,5/4)-trihydroxycyclohexane-1,2-dione acylhydrolase (decyclizing) [Anaerolineaceae bacterium]